MTATISVNPQVQTNALGFFYSQSEGYVQGVMEDDPAVRYFIAAGIYSLSASSNIWGGCAITDSTAAPATEAVSTRSVLTLATAYANHTGFTVFNQSTALIQTPQGPVPLAAAGMGINFVRFGSGARIAVAISSSNATSLQNAASNTAVYWDYTNQVLLLSGSSALPVKVLDVNVGTSKVVTSVSNLTWNNAGSCAIIQI